MFATALGPCIDRSDIDDKATGQIEATLGTAGLSRKHAPFDSSCFNTCCDLNLVTSASLLVKSALLLICGQ